MIAARFSAAAALLLLSLAANAASIPASGLDAQTPAEQQIVQQVFAGHAADLTNLPQAQRTVRAAFLEQLLSGAAVSQVQGRTITIIGAEVSDALSAGTSGDAIDVPLNVRFERCHFANTVQCEGCHFHGSLSLIHCRFDKGLHLPESQVDGELLIIQPPRALNLTHVNADHASISSRPGAAHINTLWLTGANIKTNLNLQGLTVNNLVAAQMTVGSRTMFQNVAIEDKLLLSSTTLDSFLWTLRTANGAANWPKEMVLDDFSFKSGIVTQAAPGSANAKKAQQLSEFGGAGGTDIDVTLEFLNKADFSQSAFNSYEAELDRRGETHEADDVFIEMHHARRRNDFKAANPATWLTTAFDYFQEYVLGYGRSAVPPLIWSLVFIVLGTVFFRRQDHMIATDEKAPPFSPFWYSLELFLPIVDLGVGKSWRPRQSSFLVTYARIHQIAGWILIPVALAALTGAVK